MPPPQRTPLNSFPRIPPHKILIPPHPLNTHPILPQHLRQHSRISESSRSANAYSRRHDVRGIADEGDTIRGLPEGNVGRGGDDAEEWGLRCVLMGEEGAEKSHCSYVTPAAK